jgi:hypothetical protein
LDALLENYPITEDKIKLFQGFKNGFRLEYKGPRISITTKHLKSAVENKFITKEKLQKEVKLEQMADPFPTKPISTLRTSPICIVSKHDGGWRLITHLSYPPGQGVNSFIDQEDCSVQYSSFDEIVSIVSDLGKGALLGILDIKSAFRLLSVHRADFDLLGIFFEEQYYVDKCLPMGCSISCTLFEKCSSFIQWVVSKRTGI